ncbi:MAG: ADP-ribosylation factor-like protein [Promethearchaeota archaeon]
MVEAGTPGAATIPSDVEDLITKLIDFQEREGFFVHAISQVGTANYFFEIKSPVARGQVEILMISFVFDKGVKNPERFRGLLEKFANWLKKRKHAYQAFHEQQFANKKHGQEFGALVKKVRALYDRGIELVDSAHNGQLLILGLDGVGKTSILKKLREPPPRYSDDQAPTLGVNLVRVAMDELKLMVYDIGGQRKFRDQWTTTVARPDALIYVVSLVETDKSRVEEANREFCRVVAHLRDGGGVFPVLLLGNKLDLAPKSSPKYVQKVLDVKKLKGLKWKSFLTSAKTGDGVIESFRWLISALIGS